MKKLSKHDVKGIYASLEQWDERVLSKSRTSPEGVALPYHLADGDPVVYKILVKYPKTEDVFVMGLDTPRWLDLKKLIKMFSEGETIPCATDE